MIKSNRIQNRDLPPFPPIEVSLTTTSRRIFPAIGPEHWEPVRVTAKILAEATFSDEQRLTYMAGDILNMLSWVPGFFDKAQTMIKPSNGFLKIRFQRELPFEQWLDLHLTEQEFGEWLQKQMEPIWLAFSIRNLDPEKNMGHDILYLADVLNLVICSTPYLEALRTAKRTIELD